MSTSTLLTTTVSIVQTMKTEIEPFDGNVSNYNTYGFLSACYAAVFPFACFEHKQKRQTKPVFFFALLSEQQNRKRKGGLAWLSRIAA